MIRPVSGLLLAGFIAASCEQADSVPASYCAVAAAHHTQDRRDELALTNLVAKFGDGRGFRRDGPARVDIDEYVNLQKKTVIDVTFGMGDFGSVVTVFAEEKADEGLKKELDNFLLSEVNSKFPVRHCNTIPGFAVPARSNVIK